ncbi:hypothetical protein AAE478_002591 [Parahypoxylon ruwenzoriense]
MASTYDFIIVGGKSIFSKPSVLLLEAGGKNDDKNLRVDGQRWTTFMNKELNWGYKTSPQEHCDNRELDYSRGLGLGGGSAINFGVYSVGARHDYDEWADIAGDEFFRWEHMQRRYKDLETFSDALPAGIDRKYAAPKAEHHGTSGPLKIGYAAEWEKDVPELIDTFEKAGWPLNPDHNSGNPIGMAAVINSSYGGIRSTSADMITPAPSNLTVLTGATVQRLILEGKKAVGVESNGNKYYASKEVILCAGSLDTPKILMHSGIGPADQLNKYQIPVVHDLAPIGKGLRDHMFCPLVHTRTETSTTRASFYGDEKAMEDALEQWKKDGTGPWAKYACETGIGWFKLDNLASYKEFQELPANEQKYLLQETIPHFEVFTHFPVHWIIPGFPKEALNYSCILVFYYNAQSRGEVTLQSSDPSVPLKFDPKFLGTPFDRKVAIEALRKALSFTKHEAYAKDSIAQLAGPKSESDEDLLDYWVKNIGSSWHMTGTAKMGKPGDADAAVDSSFRVKGIEGLRIGDMSVVPVLASCHVQAVAYVTGVACAERLAQEYGLN